MSEISALDEGIHFRISLGGETQPGEARMGEIVGVGLTSHAPTIMFDEATRRELNEGKEISLVPGLIRLRAEVFDRIQPDTIVIIDSHWVSTVEHILSAHEHRSGRMTSSELPRGMSAIPYDYDGDPE